ncbi:MAG: carbohydrate ABC transporter permease [Hyphomicrobiales bacterium]
MTAPVNYDLHTRSLWDRLFEPPELGRMAPLAKAIVYTLLIFWSLFVIFPIYWVVITSFKLPEHVNQGPVFVPWYDFMPSLHAWEALLVTDFGDTLRSYFNSFAIGIGSTAICMLIGSMAAYALARIQYRPRLGSILMFVAVLALAIAVIALGPYFFPTLGSYHAFDWPLVMAVALALFVLLAKAAGHKFKTRLGNGDILFWIISQRILPPIVVIIPVYMMFQSVGLVDTHIGLILAYAVANLPIVVWLMHDFFAGLPIELEESAQLDGATRFGIFREIVLPLTKPGLAATTLLVLILNWNEYLLAVFLSTSKAQTMPILVAAMNAGDRGILWWTMCVVIVVMIMPVIVMAIILQRFIAKGVLLGAVKG